MGKHYDHPLQRMDISTEVDNSSTDKPPELGAPICTQPVPTYDLPWAADELGWGLDDELSFTPDKHHDRIIITRTQASETN